MLLQLVLTALVGTTAHADNPYGNCVRNNGGEAICVGQKVITQSNSIGVVNAVFNNGQSKVRITNYSYDLDYSVDALSAESQCTTTGAICEGERVMTASNSLGSVSLVFANGKTKVRIDNYSYDLDYTSDSLTPQVGALGYFQAGTSIITQSNSTGTISSLFADGRAKVRITNYSYDLDYNISSLAYAVQMSRGVSVGDRVMTQSGSLGRVNALYSNGAAKVRIDNYSYDLDYNVSTLSVQVGPRPMPPMPNPGPNPPVPGPRPRPPVPRPGPGAGDLVIRTGDRVMTQSQALGTVSSVFSNGKAMVRIDNYSYDLSYDIVTLAKSMRVYRGFVVGQQVITRSNAVGKVTGVFTNGKATVRINGYSYDLVYNLTDISN